MTPLRRYSRLMSLLLALGQEGLAWSARRLHVPIPEDALVLEVGSGGNPYPRANVLLDAYVAGTERHGAALVADRPTILGFLEDLPFRDGAFDFVVASHVVEHSAAPERVFAELERVAAAGYIETPHAIFERLCPYLDHRLEIRDEGGVLHVWKKPSWQHDDRLAALYDERLRGAKHWNRMLRRHPFTFHVRYYWRRADGGIRYAVANPDVDASWEPIQRPPQGTSSGAGGARARLLRLARRVFSQSRRNATLDVVPLLRCPRCHGTALRAEGGRIVCRGCAASFRREGTLIRMNEVAADGATAGQVGRTGASPLPAG